MLDGINGAPGPNRNSGPLSSIAHNTGRFDARTLMRSAAIRRTILSWHISGNSAPELLKRTIESDMPELADIKKGICGMRDNEILSEADKIVIDLYEHLRTVPEVAENFPVSPSFAEFALKDLPHFNPTQLFSNSLGSCSLIFDGKDNHVLFNNDDLPSYRNAMIITIALKLISDKFDFTSQVKRYLFEIFPQMKKLTGFDVHFQELDDGLVIKIALLLRYLENEMHICFNRASLIPLDMGDVSVANVSNGYVFIKTSTLSKFSLPFGKEIEGYIVIN